MSPPPCGASSSSSCAGVNMDGSASVPSGPPNTELNPLHPPSVDEQKTFIEARLDKPLVEGDTWYAVPAPWWDAYALYLGLKKYERSGVAPGLIDCSKIINEYGRLDELAAEGAQFEFVHSEVWDYVYALYGLVPGQQPLAFPVGGKTGFLKIARKISKMTVSRFDGQVFSQYAVPMGLTMSQLVALFVKRFQLDPEGTYCLKSNSMSAPAELLDFEKDTSDYRAIFRSLGHIHLCRYTERDESSNPPPPVLAITNYAYNEPESSSSVTRLWPSSSTTTSSSSYYWSGSKRDTVNDGIAGLSNLGNTCFMNSGLQCLSNTARLRSFFLSMAYKKDVNPSNVLGCEGKLAEEFAALLKDMWQGYSTYCSPREVKEIIGKFAPQFSGYQQQDSQELLAFMLDGLHEDLNRVIKKPYVEIKPADDRPHEVVAAEAWEGHKQRNNSIVVDLFHGQFRSTLVCPDCKKVSVTFDPCMYLSLPVPERSFRHVHVIVCFLDPNRPPTKIGVKLPKSSASPSHLITAVSERFGIDQNNLVLTEVYQRKVFKVFAEHDSLQYVNFEKDILVVYEVAPVEPDPPQPALDNKSASTTDDPSDSSETNPATYKSPFSANPSQSYSYSYPYSSSYSSGAYTVSMRGPKFIKISHRLEGGGAYDYTKVFGFPRLFRIVPSTTKLVDFEALILKTLGRSIHLPVAADGTEPSEDAQKPIHLELRQVYGSSSFTNAQGFLEFYGQDVGLEILWKETEKARVYDEAADLLVEEDPHSMKEEPEQRLTLEDCLGLFLKEESLSKENAWYCPDCKDHKQASKKMELWATPDILIIHLKRFVYNSVIRDKIGSLVHFPLENLDLGGFVIGPKDPLKSSVYDLYAVSNHYGGLGGGHYTAYCKRESGEWYHFDDTRAEHVVPDQVVSTASYVLFYQRRDLPPDPYAALKPVVMDDTPTKMEDSEVVRHGASDDEETTPTNETVEQVPHKPHTKSFHETLDEACAL